LLDEETQQKQLKKIEGVLGDIPHKILLVNTGIGKFKEKITFGTKELIAKMCEETDRALMIRFDNDDALHRSAIKTISDSAKRSSMASFVVDVPGFYMYDTNENVCYAADHKKPGAPLIGFCTNVHRKMKTVYWASHRKVATHAMFVKQYYAIPAARKMWMMIVHGRNVSNRIIRKMVERQIEYDDIRSQFC
jgi:hypothetical protein